jgi:hypothetical protein
LQQEQRWSCTGHFHEITYLLYTLIPNQILSQTTDKISIGFYVYRYVLKFDFSPAAGTAAKQDSNPDKTSQHLETLDIAKAALSGDHTGNPGILRLKSVVAQTLNKPLNYP